MKHDGSPPPPTFLVTFRMVFLILEVMFVPLNLFTFLHRDQEGGLKDRLTVAVRRIEGHRKELEVLRGKLETRRQVLFESTVKALEKKDEARANVYASEHSELKKVIHVVTANELALTQIIVRLESMRDVGDVIYQMNSAFKILKRVSGTVTGMVPALENATQEVNSTLTGVMEGLGTISPNFSLSVKTESEEEIVERAKTYAEEKALELKEQIPSSILTAKGETILEKTHNLALLATGDASDDADFSPLIISKPKSRNVEEDVYNYVAGRDGRVNILEASATLSLQADEVEKAVLKLASEGKIRLT